MSAADCSKQPRCWPRWRSPAEYDANDVDVSAWVIFFGFVNTHQRHARHFRGASQHYLLALNMSVLFGSIVGLGLLGYYFMQVAWYCPVALFVAGSSQVDSCSGCWMSKWGSSE